MTQSKVGVESLYKILNVLQTEFESNPFVNVVTSGTLTEIDLQKQTMFPLAHIVLNSVTHDENSLAFNFTIFNLDKVSIIKDENQNDIYLGNDNYYYILTNQLYVINRLISRLKQSTIYGEGWELVGAPTSEVINKEMENMLAGYQTTFDVVLPNNINKCYEIQ